MTEASPHPPGKQGGGEVGVTLDWGFCPTYLAQRQAFVRSPTFVFSKQAPFAGGVDKLVYSAL